MRVFIRESLRRRLLSGLSTAVLCATGATIGAAFPVGMAHAQEAETDEIVVTARLREERLMDVPVAITALTGEQLDGYNVTSVGDIASFVPTMVVGRQVTGSSASVFLRGVGSSSLSAGFDQSVSFSLDGLPMSRGREVLFSQFDLSGVEVLKGPQALYFGRNTTGGLISLRTNNPGTAFEARGRAGYGFEGEETYFEGVLSGPITDSFGARLAIRASDSEGSLVNTAGPSTDPATGFARSPVASTRGGSEAISARLTLEYEPSAEISYQLKAGFTDYSDNGAGDNYERLCGGGRTTPAATSGFANPFADCVIDGRSDHSTFPTQVLPLWRYSRDGHPYTDLSSLFAIGTGNWTLGDFTLTSITGYYEFKQEDLNDFNGATRSVGVSQLADYDQFSQEVRLQSNFEGPLNFMAGVFYGDTNFTFNTDVYILPLPFDAINQTYTTFRRDNGFEASTLSAFAELTWDIAPTLELSGGARWSRDERDSFQQSLPANSAIAGTFPQNIRLEDAFTDENLSPQATLTWRPSNDISIYGAYKEGYKAGGFNISQTITAACNAAPINGVPACVLSGRFASETARGWEIGARTSLFDGALRLNATVYDYLYEDLQVQFYNPVTTGQVVSNAGELRTTGAEADFAWAVPAIDGLDLRGAIAYNKAEYDDFIGQCFGGQTPAQGCNQQPNAGGVFNGQVYSGRTAPKAPEWAGTLGGAYEWALGSDWRASVTLDATYSSEYYFTDTLRPDAVQDSFTRIDASINVFSAAPGWRVSVIGRNLSDELVVTSANDMSFTGGTGTGTANGVVSDMNVVIERPREVYLELSYEF